jgi:AAA+ ATPase superfamily predicted ATPase
MKTFKFGQLLEKGDICNRENETKVLSKICGTGGRAVVYGSRRYGKTSLVKNVIMKDFLDENKKSLAIYVDYFQLESMEDASARLQLALAQALSQRAKVKTFLGSVLQYLKHFQVEISADPLTGAPKINLSGQHKKAEGQTLNELFETMHELSADYKFLLVIDEFQDVKLVSGLEARMRSEMQKLSKIPIIVLGSKRHILRDIFHDESKPFYGFGTDVEIEAIERKEWFPYMQERFEPYGISVKMDSVNEICQLMRDVPNSIQELCQWIALRGEKGALTADRIHRELSDLIDNKETRYMEKVASLSAKERKVLVAVAHMEPVAAITATAFIKAAGISATATRSAVSRFADQGLLDITEEGYVVTDPIFRLFLVNRL